VDALPRSRFRPLRCMLGLIGCERSQCDDRFPFTVDGFSFKRASSASRQAYRLSLRPEMQAVLIRFLLMQKRQKRVP
jgi:hypothetical protein